MSRLHSLTLFGICWLLTVGAGAAQPCSPESADENDAAKTAGSSTLQAAEPKKANDPSEKTAPQTRDPERAAKPAQARPETVSQRQNRGRAAAIEALRRATPAEREARIRAALDQTTAIEFPDVPLKEAMDFLSDLHHILIILDEAALTEEGIATDEPINQTLDENVSLRSALHIMLQPLGLTYVIEDEVLKITTRDQATTRLRTEIYDVRALEQAGVTSETIVRLVTSTVDRQSWKETGGYAVIEPIPGGVVVAQTEVNHEKIAALLKKVAEFATAPQSRQSSVQNAYRSAP